MKLKKNLRLKFSHSLLIKHWQRNTKQWAKRRELDSAATSQIGQIFLPFFKAVKTAH
jgi:hypothetical protein